MYNKYVKYKTKYLKLKKKILDGGNYKCNIPEYKCVNDNTGEYLTQETCFNSCVDLTNAKYKLEKEYENMKIIYPIPDYFLTEKENFVNFIKNKNEITKVMMFINLIKIETPENLIGKIVSYFDIFNWSKYKILKNNNVEILKDLSMNTDTCITSNRLIFFGINKKDYDIIKNKFVGDTSIIKKYSTSDDSVFEYDYNVIKHSSYNDMLKLFFRMFDINKNIKEEIRSCLMSNKLTYIPVSIFISEKAVHENAIIIDRENKKIFHFEPNVELIPGIKTSIKDYFLAIDDFRNYTFEFLDDVACPIGIQQLSKNYTCQSWVLYYALLKISNPTKSTMSILQHLLDDENYVKIKILEFLYHIKKKYNDEINKNYTSLPIQRDLKWYQHSDVNIGQYSEIKKIDNKMNEAKKNIEKTEMMIRIVQNKYVITEMKTYLKNKNFVIDTVYEKVYNDETKNRLRTISDMYRKIYPMISKYFTNNYNEQIMSNIGTITIPNYPFYEGPSTNYKITYINTIDRILYGLENAYSVNQNENIKNDLIEFKKYIGLNDNEITTKYQNLKTSVESNGMPDIFLKEDDYMNLSKKYEKELNEILYKAQNNEEIKNLKNLLVTQQNEYDTYNKEKMNYVVKMT